MPFQGGQVQLGLLFQGKMRLIVMIVFETSGMKEEGDTLSDKISSSIEDEDSVSKMCWVIG